MTPRGKLGNVRPTSRSRAERSVGAPMLRCFRFRNYLSEQWLFVAGWEAGCASNFGLANGRLVGIVSVSRSVQSVNFARARTKAAMYVPYQKPGLFDTSIGHVVLL